MLTVGEKVWTIAFVDDILVINKLRWQTKRVRTDDTLYEGAVTLVSLEVDEVTRKVAARQRDTSVILEVDGSTLVTRAP